MQTRSRTKVESSPPKPAVQMEDPDMSKSLANLTLQSTVRLASGAAMPRLGFGVYQARGDECKNAVTAALKDGYRHIDSAQAYHNETLVASGLAASGVPRTSVFITTKFMPGHSVPTDEEVYTNLIKSPTRLDPAGSFAYGKKASKGERAAYIDLLLIHSPRPNADARAVHWAQLARAQKEGWARDIGVSNFGVHHLKALPGPTPAVNQIELHPWCQQRDIVAYCADKGIIVQAYCPIARADPGKLKTPALVQIAEKHGKEVTQVLLRWSLQKGYVPLPKSVTPARIKQNTELYDFELDKEDMESLDALDEGAAGAVSWNPVNQD